MTKIEDEAHFQAEKAYPNPEAPGTYGYRLAFEKGYVMAAKLRADAWDVGWSVGRADERKSEEAYIWGEEWTPSKNPYREEETE